MPLLSLEQARAERERLRRAGRRLLFTNGHFTLLHYGHLRYLEMARALGNEGDALYVGVNDDDSSLRLKGRAIIPAPERAALVAALRPVSAAIIFAEDTAHALIDALRPEIYIKGGDYALRPGHPDPLPERAAVEAYGGRVVIVDYLPEHSATRLLQRIAALRET